MTLTRRTRTVTGGSHRVSTTRSRSSSLTVAKIGQGGGVDVLEVVEEQAGPGDDQAHLGGIVPVAGVGGVEGKGEPFGPAAVEPALAGARGGGRRGRPGPG